VAGDREKTREFWGLLVIGTVARSVFIHPHSKSTIEPDFQNGGGKQKCIKIANWNVPLVGTTKQFQTHIRKNHLQIEEEKILGDDDEENGVANLKKKQKKRDHNN